MKTSLCCVFALASSLTVASAAPVEIVVSPSGGDDTAAIQGAFDECFRKGGGTVVVERGEYAVKGLRLRSDTTLLLKGGAA